MPLDKEKSDLFRAKREREQELKSNGQPDEANNKKIQEFENFCDIVRGIKAKKNEIKKLEKSKDSAQLNKLKEELQEKELDYQIALRSAESALVYQLENNFIDRTSKATAFFKKPNAEAANSKGTTPTFSS